MPSRYNLWKTVIRHHLPRCCLKHVAQIHANIAAVDSGIKPSFLFDYAYVMPRVMAKFVEQLYAEGLTSYQLDIISLEDNVLITRIEQLRDHLQDAYRADYKKTILVDISKHLKCPEILTELDSQRLITSCFESLNAALGDLDVPFKVVNLLSDSNVTTLFGLLIGYPVVYWYSTESMDAKSCLDMIPLHVVKVFCTMNECEQKPENGLDSGIVQWREHSMNQSSLIYSWSYPESLRTECEEYAARWQKTVDSAATKQKSIKSLLFEDELVTLPVLAM